MKYVSICFISLFSLSLVAQQRTILRGKLLYRNNNVIAANVVNNTAQSNTITNGDGEFEILAKIGDEIIFSSVQFRIKSLTVTQEIMQKNRLVVEVNERLTLLDEIVVGPENTEKFLDLKKEEFKRIDYRQDKSTRVENTIIDQHFLRSGINIINVAKLLASIIQKEKNGQKQKLHPSRILPQIFEPKFFTEDLELEQAQVVGFLENLDKSFPSNDLFKKDKEFELIEYLYKASESYKKDIEK